MKFLQWWNVVFLWSCIIAVALDPLFFYLPVITEDKKCIRLDKKLWITAIVLQSFFDIIYLMHIILQFRTGFIDDKHLKRGRPVLNTNARNYFWPRFLWDVLTILPIPQVRESSANFYLNLLVVQDFLFLVENHCCLIRTLKRKCWNFVHAVVLLHLGFFFKEKHSWRNWTV